MQKKEFKDLSKQGNIKHINGFDLLRIISITAVVGIHSFFTDLSLTSLVRNLSFAIPCFVLIAVYLSVRHINNDGSRINFLKRRAVRLMPAFLVWTAIYVIARLINGGIANPSLYDFAGYLFLGSSALHLYFIPMIYYYSVLLIFIPKPIGFRLPICLIGLFAATWLRYAGIPAFHFGTPEADAFPFYFLYNLPYLFLGIVLFDLIEQSTFSEKTSNHSGLFSLIFGFSSLAFWFGPQLFNITIPVQDIIRDTFLFLTFLFLPADIPEWMTNIATVIFGVYLSHHLILEGLLWLETLVGFDSSTTLITIMRFAVAIISLTAFCIILGKSKRTAWLVR